jgi:hypothetical protein
MRAAKRRQRRDRGLQIDALTAVQVEKHRDLTPEQLIAQLESVIPKAIRARSRIPSFVRNRKLPERQLVGGTWEDWTIGFLTEVVLTRDPFMHRIDIARATGTQMQLEAGTEGRLVADAAAEWAERHGQPCTVHLTGPAGGTYSWGSGGPEITYDALEFCRALADRAPLDDLFGQSVPF